MESPRAKRLRPTVAPSVGFGSELKALFAAKEAATNAPREVFPVRPSEIVRLYGPSGGHSLGGGGDHMDLSQ